MTNEELQRLRKIEAVAGTIVRHYDQHRASGLSQLIEDLRTALGTPRPGVKVKPRDRVRQLRELAEMTPEQLANRSRISNAKIRGFEAGRLELTKKEIIDLSEALRVAPWDIDEDLAPPRLD